MTDAGMLSVDIAKQNGKWDGETDANRNLIFSAELLKLLQSNLIAFAEFTSLPSSHKKQYTNWVMSAKKPETKERRMKEMIRVLESGEEMRMM